MAIADFNNDGKKDVVGTNYSGSAVSFLAGDGAGGLASAKVRVEPNLVGGRVVVADFNGDGRPDAAIPEGYVASVLIYLSDAAGNLLGPTSVPLGRPAISIATADFNHDGKADLVLGHDLVSGSSVVSVLLGNGSGGFSGPTTFSINTGNMQTEIIIPGKFDADDNVDLVLLIGTFPGNFVKLLRGDGSGGFGPASLIPSSGSTTWIDSGDFNGDGKTDLALANFSPSSVIPLLNDGSANFTASNPLAVPAKPSYVRAADLNKDGRPDLITLHDESNQIGTFLNTGSGFSAPQSFGNFTGARAVAVADVNGDTNVDLVLTTNVAAGNIGVMTGDSLGNFAAPLYFTSGGAATDIAIADFNADGRPDFITPYYPAILMNTFTVLPCLSINDVSINEPDSGTTTANFSVSLSGPSAETVRVNYLTTGVDATAGVDFTSVTGRLAFAPGETSKLISIPIVGDLLNEANEAFKISLSNPAAAAISDGEGLGTIVDNDPLPSLSINDISTSDSGSLLGNFTVTLSAPSGRPVTVQYATANGTAVAGTQANGDDYFATSGTLTIAAGQTSATISVNIFADATYEPDETFFMNLSNPANATISDGQGQATILNDDSVPTLTINDAFVSEGNSGTLPASFSVRLSNPTYLPVTFNYSTSDNTATAGSDYVATSGTFTFNPTETLKTISVPVIGDTVDETSETFFLDITNLQNATGGTTRAQGFIGDDDGPTISVNDVAVIEGNSGTKSATFTLTLSAVSPETLSVRVTSAPDTATANNDYLSFNGTLTIPAGTTSRTFNVTINGDTASEPDESFFVNLSNPVSGSIARAQGKGIIISDDNASGNPIDLQGFFVRQHYVDFLNREPDVAGFEFWRNQITACGSDTPCTEVRRINDSASFFLSIEFQQTGYLVERFYKTAYGDGTGSSAFGANHQLPVPIVRLNEFLADTQRLGQGVIVLQSGWEQALDNNKQAYALEFVQKTRFTDAFPLAMTPADFIDKLNQNAGNVLSADERLTALNLFSGAVDSSNVNARAKVVRMVAEDPDLYNAELNRAFVLTQYFGYLRRNPNDAPESTLDYTGYDFWLTKLNQFGGNYIAAEMVKAFISSSEYRQRFGP